MIDTQFVKRSSKLLILLLFTAAGTLPALAVGIGASATYTSTSSASVPGAYDYNFTLSNTGDTTIGTFWFSWIPGAGFLSVTPTAVSSPVGWTFTQTNAGKAIRWVTPAASLLQPGQFLSGFSFTSTETPDQLLLNYSGTGVGAGLPMLTSVVYAGAPNVGPSAQFVPTAAATPEPGTMLLTLTGLGMAAGSIRSRWKQRFA